MLKSYQADVLVGGILDTLGAHFRLEGFGE